MSTTVVIDYSELQDSVDNAYKTARKMDDYAEQLEKNVFNKLLNVDGADPRGNVSSAASMVSQKVKNLRDNSAKFTSFASKTTQFINNTKAHDTNIGNKLESITETYVGQRTTWQKIGDFLYNTFCVDIPNSNGFTRFLCDIRKNINSRREAIFNKVVSWFKHGGGKYVLNILGAIAGVAAAVVGAIVAIVTIPVSAGVATVLGIIAAAAAVVGAVITGVNALVQIWQNGKAIKIYYGNGDEGMARYYGNISKYSDYTKKYDFGGEKENSAVEKTGEIIDNTKTVADITGIVAGTGLKLGQTTTTYYGTERINGVDFSKENVVKNIKKSIGFTASKKDPNKLEFNFKKALENSFNKDETVKVDPKNKDFRFLNKDTKFQETVHKIKKSTNLIDKIKKVDLITDKADNGKELWGETKTVLELIGDFKVTTPIKDVTKLIDNIYKLVS